MHRPFLVPPGPIPSALVALLLAAGCGSDLDPVGPARGLELNVSPSTVTLRPGGGAVVFATVSRQGGLDGPVTLRVTGLPSGVQAEAVTFPEGEVEATLFLAAAPDAPLATVAARVEATAPGVSPARATVQVTVEAVGAQGGFTLSLDPSPLSIRENQRDSVRITVSRSPPFEGPVRLEVVELPMDVTALLSPVEVTGTRAMLLVEVGPRAELGDATITLVGRGAGVPDQAARLVLTTFGEPFPNGP